MVTVAFYHAFQQAGMLFVDTNQAVLFDDKDAQAITGIKHFGRHRVV